MHTKQNYKIHSKQAKHGQTWIYTNTWENCNKFLECIYCIKISNKTIYLYSFKMASFDNDILLPTSKLLLATFLGLTLWNLSQLHCLIHNNILSIFQSLTSQCQNWGKGIWERNIMVPDQKKEQFSSTSHCMLQYHIVCCCIMLSPAEIHVPTRYQ